MSLGQNASEGVQPKSVEVDGESLAFATPRALSALSCHMMDERHRVLKTHHCPEPTTRICDVMTSPTGLGLFKPSAPRDSGAPSEGRWTQGSPAPKPIFTSKGTPESHAP